MTNFKTYLIPDLRNQVVGGSLAVVFYILPQLLSKMVGRVEKLNKRAAKLNRPPFVLSVDEDDYIQLLNKERTTKVRVTLVGEMPVVSGWRFVGVVTRLDNGRDLVTGDIPAQFRDKPHSCDHCHTNRRRKKTIILQSEETGEHIRVGRSCLAVFFDDRHPEQLADSLLAADDVKELGETDECFGGGGSFPLVVSAQRYLALAARSVREHGWHNSSANRPTWVEAREAARDPNVVPEEQDKTKAQAVLAWVDSLRERDDLHGYLANLEAALDGGVLSGRVFPLAASALVAYDREMEQRRAAEREATNKSVSRYVGAVKQRAEFEVTVDRVISWETDWGWMDLVKMTDADGNILVWKSSSANLQEGDRVTLRATVKEHKEYRDEKQTVLTRASVRRMLVGDRAELHRAGRHGFKVVVDGKTVKDDVIPEPVCEFHDAARYVERYLEKLAA